MTSLTQTIHELAGKGTQGLTLTATPLFGALALERQLVLSTNLFRPAGFVVPALRRGKLLLLACVLGSVLTMGA